MAIILTPSVSSLQNRDYIHVEREINFSKTTTTDSQDCFFRLFNCDIPMPQFIDLLDPNDKFKNDFFSFIFELQDGQTMTAELFDAVSGLKLDDINNDDYGDLQDLGDYADRPLVWSFIVNWNKTHALQGFGKFTFKFTIKNSANNVVSEQESICFHLMPFDCDEAHGTVRIETLQTGYIHNGFDYRDISTQITAGFVALQEEGWRQQIRWFGRFSPDLPDEEADFIQDSDRIERQIQEKITNKYKLQLKRLRSNIGIQLTNDNFIADQILISDYNLENYEFYRNREVRKISTDELNSVPMQSSITMSWTFKDVNEGTLKRVHG